MTNIAKISTDENMHSHKDVLAFLDEYLRYGYVKECKKRLLKQSVDVTHGHIRNVKSGVRTDWKVLEVLAEIASENKAAKDRVAELINN